jgi:site-specific recombinase XerD
MPYALARKYPKAASEWRWQFVFPQQRWWVNERMCEQGRHHVHETILQKGAREAVSDASLLKRIGCHTFRHSFAIHLLEDEYDIRFNKRIIK